MIKIEIDDKELKDILRKYFEKTKNTKPLMISIAETMNEAVAKNFEKEGRPTKWTELSEITKKKRAKSFNSLIVGKKRYYACCL